jgi:hypothetical protein
MKFISILMVAGIAVQFVACKAAGKRGGSGLASADSGNTSLAVRDRNSFTDVELEQHEKYVESKLPGGVYLVQVPNMRPHNFPNDGVYQSCDKVYNAAKSGTDADLIAKLGSGYAADFGFEKCTVANFYKGIMPLRTCVEAVECVGKKIRDAKGFVHISMLYNFDYKQGDEGGGSQIDCLTNIIENFSINGKRSGVAQGSYNDDQYDAMVFTAKGNAESTAKGCIVRMTN